MSKIYQLWNKEYFLFSFSRAIGILIKPTILYFLISYNFENFADHYSRLLIILISVFSFLGFPYYFNFYKSYFESEKKILIENEIDIYLKDFVVFNFIVMPIIFCLSLIIFENIFLASCCCLLLFFEKILDEVQRSQQYSKKFSSWSVLFLVKNFLPMQPGDVPVTFADVDELIDDVGFKPETSIRDGLREFVGWYRKRDLNNLDVNSLW